jgi:UDP-N-acetylmuramoyl-tripeptide--D-alanyl-D-alanine ligase
VATPIPANRARFTAAELAGATGASLFEVEATAPIEGVATDSREAPAGALFVALRGESHDGHRFAAAARERGALPLVERGSGVEGPRLEVPDSLAALGAIARAFVERQAERDGERPVLAIGGAAGKTTTKSLAAAGVEALFGPTLVTAGNLNNRIGVPMTLLTLEPRHRAIVLELGTSEPGEIAALGRVARPDVGLVLNVGIEHSERLGGLEAIAEEEGALLEAARRAAVTSADERLLVERLARSPAPVRLRFGESPTADVRVASRTLEPDGGARVVLALAPALRGERASGELEVRTRLLGPHAAGNLAAATAGALALLGRPPSADELDRLARALGGVAAVPGRLRPLALGDLLVLDDAYNSNPRSAAAALAAARELADRRGATLVAALGDMLELGEHAADEHDALLAAAAAAAPRLLVAIGNETSSALARRGSWPGEAVAFPDSAAAADAIGELVRDAEVVLVKGSRGVRTERLIATLAGRAGVALDLRL